MALGYWTLVEVPVFQVKENTFTITFSWLTLKKKIVLSFLQPFQLFVVGSSEIKIWVLLLHVLVLRRDKYTWKKCDMNTHISTQFLSARFRWNRKLAGANNSANKNDIWSINFAITTLWPCNSQMVLIVYWLGAVHERNYYKQVKFKIHF